MPFKIKSCWTLLLSILICGCAALKNGDAVLDTLPATALQPYGRTAITDQKLELISSAAHLAFSFEGETCNVFASLSGGQHHNYIQYELDGVYQKRIRIEAGARGPVTIMAARGGKHTVKIYKATEAHTGPVFIEKIEGKQVKAITPPKLPLIEFIGNSITCGAAADPSEVPCGTGSYHDQHDAYYAYGPRVARALNANFILSSVSGIGIYRNWNSNGPTMPQVYKKTDFQHSSTRNWNFSQYTPSIVSIALGTNDYSNGDGKSNRQPFDSASFVNQYITFVQLVKEQYPQSRIALLSSPMLNGDRRTTLQNCLTTVKDSIDRQYSGVPKVALYFFKPMQARGCTGHPNVEDHAILAAELQPFFKALLQ